MVLEFSVVFLLTSLFSYILLTEQSTGMTDEFPLSLSDSLSPEDSFIRVNNNITTRRPIDRYYNLAELRDLLLNFENDYYSIVKVIDVRSGEGSATGDCIYGVRITKNVRYKRDFLKPMFKFVANIQGDDTVGYAMMVTLMQYLAVSYRTEDPRIVSMLNNIDIYIVPNLNSYGFTHSNEGRCASGYSVNQEGLPIDGNFPDQYTRSQGWTPARETVYMQRFIRKHPFVLSGNLQGGAIVASYPLDCLPDKNGVPIITPDIEILERMAKTYAELNAMMASETACNKYFPDGACSGHNWRRRPGSMQDFNYFHSNCFELSFYLSCCKYPEAKLLPLYWRANLESMLTFIESTRVGVYGVIKDLDGSALKNAVIRVEGFDKEIKTTIDGEYWRLLTPGSTYTIIASTQACRITKTTRLDPENPYVRLDFQLTLTGFFGQVRDQKGNCLPDAEVIVEGEGHMRVNEHGEYCIPAPLMTKGYYTVRAAAPGYGIITEVVKLPTASFQLDFVLTSLE